MRHATILLTAALVLAGLVSPVLAANKYQAKTVRVCSSHGNGCTTAQIKQGHFGPMVRLKGGTWIDCRGDCRETLREEQLDFWETQNDKALFATP
jgi:hypothetical protein